MGPGLRFKISDHLETHEHTISSEPTNFSTQQGVNSKPQPYVPQLDTTLFTTASLGSNTMNTLDMLLISCRTPLMPIRFPSTCIQKLSFLKPYAKQKLNLGNQGSPSWLLMPCYTVVIAYLRTLRIHYWAVVR